MLFRSAAGNLRVLMTMAAELLDAGVQRELAQLDEKLYFEVFAVPPRLETTRSPRGAKALATTTRPAAPVQATLAGLAGARR